MCFSEETFSVKYPRKSLNIYTLRVHNICSWCQTLYEVQLCLLHTISNGMVKMNGLRDLDEISKIELPAASGSEYPVVY